MIFLIILFLVIVVSIFLYIYLNGDEKTETYNYTKPSLRKPKIDNRVAEIMGEDFKIPKDKAFVPDLSDDNDFINDLLNEDSPAPPPPPKKNAPVTPNTNLDDDDFINGLLNKGYEEDEEEEDDDEEEEDDEEDDGTANRDKKAEEKALDDMVLQAPEQFDIETLTQVAKRLGNTEKGKFAQKALEKKLKEKDKKRER
ncbi:MAG: hypothetical protein Ta2D_00060 [Rickettsiales bacterium]|nr:MAG: hypothetical protein Ta2D_00060 [Rickettsiales bacterium]